MEKLVIAWDLDGTLIDSSHRSIFSTHNADVALKHWKENCIEEQINKDVLLPLSQMYFEFKKTGFTQICVTARDMNEFDFKYLKDHGLEFALILHRKDSQELDSVLKDKKLQDFFNEKGRIPFMAFDDKQDNLNIFDKYGFRTFQAVYMNHKLQKDSFNDIKVKPGQF